ncbi:MAG TPA: hypothetical protein VGG75_40090 [Trebonia sp.]|jgi:hypothetical protein
MTAYRPLHASDVEIGEPQPSLLTPAARFFRRAIAAVRRKEAAPAAPRTAGAVTPLLADAEPVMGNDMIASVRGQWDAWHAEDVALTGHPATAPAGFPVLGPEHDAAPVNGPLPRRVPGATIRENGGWA